MQILFNVFACAKVDIYIHQCNDPSIIYMDYNFVGGAHSFAFGDIQLLTQPHAVTFERHAC